MDALTLYHTSPGPITHIRSDGLFGDSLCFAVRPYVMTAAARPQVYRIDLPCDQIVEASTFFYRDDCDKLAGIVAQVVEMVGCDEDAAENLLSGRRALVDMAEDFDPEQDFEIQRLQAEAAKVLGYRACQTIDEQGVMWLVSMSGHEADLIDVTNGEGDE